MARLYSDQFPQAIDANGAPISGAKLYFYITGTTTPKDTFSQSDLAPGSVNANPVVADSAGRFGPIYLAQDADYKAILKDASDVTIGTRDPLLTVTTSVIAHQGSLIIGSALGADSELLIGAADTRLTSNGSTAAWRAANYTVQKFLSGSGTYNRPASCTSLRIRIMGGGGGGGGCGQTTNPTGATGATSSFNAITAIGGTGGTGGTGAADGRGGIGGTGGAGTALRIVGAGGDDAVSVLTVLALSGHGGDGAFGGGGRSTSDIVGVGSTGIAGAANSGGGGAGSLGNAASTHSSGGGGSGEYAEFIILAPSASYSYVVGGGGAGGIGTGTGAQTGGAGGSGVVIVEEFYA